MRDLPVAARAYLLLVYALAAGAAGWMVMSYTGGIARVALEDDAATIRQRLESVKGSVLIDAHGEMPARLYPGKRAVR